MSSDTHKTLTEILQAAGSDGQRAVDDALPLVYEELRRIAQQQLAHETPGQTLQPTALVHEAYFRLIGNDPLRWESRGHFFAAAAEAMRRILIERARARQTVKRVPGGMRVPMEEALATLGEIPAAELLELDEGLARLRQRDPRKAQVVSLKFFAGLTNEDTAEALGISLTTVKEDWQFARAWLHRELSREA